MVNPYRGEVALTVDGMPRVMRLTLGALAELESALQVSSLVALVERFETGAYSSRDVIAVLEAGLRAGGHECDLRRSEIEGGPMAGAKAAAELLVRAFALPE